MEAPDIEEKNPVLDKIYLGENSAPNCSVYHSYKVGNSDIEYTRTDAFIEKAVEYIANNMRCDGYTLQTKAKFIKSFKNYMKG